MCSVLFDEGLWMNNFCASLEIIHTLDFSEKQNISIVKMTQK
jgi:hypothetical protein